MGTITRQYGMSGKVQADSRDTLTVDYEYTHDTDVTDETQIVDVFNGAWAVGLPRKRQRLGTTNLFAYDFPYRQNETVKRKFTITVEYRRPEQLGAEALATADLHPIYHPVRNTIGYIEKETVVEKAYNVEAITGGAARAANTLGYIQNGAGVVSENPIIEIDRQPIIISRKNVSALGPVLAMNKAYANGGLMRTTNSDTVTIEGNTYGPRTLKFAGLDVGDQMEFDGIPYWEAERRVEIHETTSWIFDSVGTQYVSETGKMVPILQHNSDDEETQNEITEPIPINLDGSPGTPGTSVQITYYYLTAIPYAPILGV